MPRKSKRESILDKIEADPDVDMQALRAMGRQAGTVLWTAMNGTQEQTEDAAEVLLEQIVVYAAEED